ncbi:serine hydrolase [Sphingomonas sp. MMS12-HWE2-04]|uniref:serine hydrolase n=1 Tax=Sphingomonas sp. MMS12-HWE2-04 TaxID=3234199 RepID=UPI00384C02AB
MLYPAAVLLALAAPAASAQTAPVQAVAVKPAPGFEARVRELAGILAGTGDYDGFFTSGFRAQVPKAQFAAIGAQLVQANGPVQRIEGFEMVDPYAGTVRVAFRDATATIQMRVEPSAPNQVSSLLVTGFAAREASVDAVLSALQGLHGTTGFAVAKLGAGAPALVKAHNADRAFAVGSAFKLVILAELVRATNAGERRWDDLVTLDGAPLPGGGYNLKPKGTQVSIRELATQMISISDNSATDILLATLGREKVEAMLPVVGVADPARNVPFLGTLEAFKLKYVQGGAYAKRYAALDLPGKRALLSGEVAAIPLILVSPPPGPPKPTLIDQVEWFFTPADIVRILDWLRRNSDGPKGADVRAVLSKNPGIGPAAAKWQWVGYKGGSEPGVIEMSLLLQAKNGEWYVVTGSWNDTLQPVEESRFAALISRAAELLAP